MSAEGREQRLLRMWTAAAGIPASQPDRAQLMAHLQSLYETACAARDARQAAWDRLAEHHEKARLPAMALKRGVRGYEKGQILRQLLVLREERPTYRAEYERASAEWDRAFDAFQQACSKAWDSAEQAGSG